MTIEYVGWVQVVLGILARFWPVWLAMAVTLGLSVYFRKKLGLYGQLFSTGAGVIGLSICFFWLFTALFASTIAVFNPLDQIAVLKNALPGAIAPGSAFFSTAIWSSGLNTAMVEANSAVNSQKKQIDSPMTPAPVENSWP